MLGLRWMVKRAVALPGDPVPRETVPALRDVPEPVVPQGCLVVVGDNTGHSHDSRGAGYFPAATLLGVVIRQLR
jgi:signal peptidase I